VHKDPPGSIATVVLVAFLSLLAGPRCAAVEGPVAPPKDAPETPRRDPAGMVRFQGGRVKVGIDRKALLAIAEATEVGRMGNWKIAFESELSVCTPEHEVDLPAFWIGKYEVTNAQWHHFLEKVAKTTYTVPPLKQPGERNLEDISKRFLLGEKYRVQGGGYHHPVAVDWKGLYELNMDVLNPTKGPDGKEIDPKSRPPADSFRAKVLPPGTKITCYRYSVPLNWRLADRRLRSSPPPGRENQPVTCISLVDVSAFAAYFGLHIPTEQEWEGAARGPGGTIYPEGNELHPLGHAWKGFNAALEKAQVEAKAKLPRAREEEAAAAGDEAKLAKARAVVKNYEWVLRMKPFPDEMDPLCVEVGLFPLGRSPCGAMDLIGNVDEWTSSLLTAYPGTDSKADGLGYTAYVLRGANLLDKDTLLMAPYRKFLMNNKPIGRTFVSSTLGFRVARYESPGASSASHVVPAILASSPSILPREYDSRTKAVGGPGLDIYGAVGIERVDEVDWTQDQPEEKDPAGKVFYLGRAESVCAVPASGIRYKDAGAIRNAAASNPHPSAIEGRKPADKREPIDIPFFGLLHLSEGMEIKAEGVKTSEVHEVALTPEEMKQLRELREAEKKAKQEKEKEDAKKDGGDKDGEKKDKAAGPGDPKPPAPKGGDKGGEKKDEGEKKEGEEPAPEEEDEEKEPPLPTTKQETKITFKPGFVKGRECPAGLLMGMIKRGSEPRLCLWEARQGIGGSSSAPGGLVLLEEPFAVLDRDAVSLRKVPKPALPFSSLDEQTGDVRLLFFIPVEGKGDPSKREAIEVTLNLKLGDYPPTTANTRWVSSSKK